jgi:hypothetical protein
LFNKNNNRRLKYGDGSSAQKSSARKNCSTPKSQLLDTIRADAQIYATAQKSKKVSFQADASFRPKCTTAQIATARQKH